MVRTPDHARSFRSGDFNGPGARPPGQSIKAAAPPSGACPGPCNKRHQEAWAGYVTAVEGYDPLDPGTSRPEPPETAYWRGDPVWCAACTSKITTRLAQMDYLAAILSAAADGHRSSAGLERVSGTSEAISPSQAGDDLEEMFSMLSTWEAVYRTLKGWSSGPPRGELASRETECINWLQRHLHGILVSDVAADFGLEILQWHREVAGSAKAGVRTVRKPMRCPSCKYVTLFWTEGEVNVYCKNASCGRILSLSQYEAEAERQAGILQRGGEAISEEHEEQAGV